MRSGTGHCPRIGLAAEGLQALRQAPRRTGIQRGNGRQLIRSELEQLLDQRQISAPVGTGVDALFKDFHAAMISWSRIVLSRARNRISASGAIARALYE